MFRIVFVIFLTLGSILAAEQFDVIVIGSGGGTKLVRPVAKLGKKVAIIEKERLGGTCLNRGCIPSKMLIHTADVATAIREAHKFNIKPSRDFQINFDDLIERVSKTVHEESDSIKPIYEEDKNITYFHGHATFIDNNKVKVGDKTITAKKIVIATGAEAALPDIKGLSDTPYLTYRDALKNKKKPKKLLVLGGGYIACELGYFFGALDTDVHFFVRSELIRKEDKDIKQEFQKAFEKAFNIHHIHSLEEVSYEDGEFTLSYKTKSKKLTKIKGDALLVATGIKPNTSELGIENTSVTLNEKGFIEVDQYMKTQQDGIYAIGDCVGKFLFRHSVNFEGEYLFENLFVNKSPKPIEYPFMPHAVFTNPQVASIGPTEDELIAQNIRYFKGVCPYNHSAMGMALRSEIGLVKLLFEESSKKLIAAHIVGHEASILIHILMAFIMKKADLDDLLKMIYIHPALPEVVRNAARDAKKNMT